MKHIEVSDDNYALLVANQGEYETLEEFIMALFQFWRGSDYIEHKEVVEQLEREQRNEVDKGIKKSKVVNDGNLWQFVASRLPNFPYGFFEYFELHSPAGKHPPIDGIAFPGLESGNIIRVDLLDYQLTSPYPHGQNKRQIKDCVNNNNISFKIINPKDLNLNFRE